MEDKLVTLAILTYAKAQILKNVLENEGIEAYIHNVNLIQPVISSGVRLRIKENDLPHALQIIESTAWLSEDIIKGKELSLIHIYSMLAEDVTPSRLDKSKKLISRLVDTFNNDKVGLIVFAGDAFTQLPITSDYVSAKMFLETINPSLITTQGTDIGAAIRLAMKSFTPQEGVGRAIIVITDGENHEGGAVEAAQEAAEKGMQVFVLGVGSPDGSPIPAEDGSNNFRRDKDGNVIVTRLNEQMCQEIAKAGNGMYIRVDNTNSAEKVLNNEIAKLSKADVESQVYTEFDEQFQALAWLVLILLVVEMLILERKNPLFKNVRLFK